jgi:CubicO group peptidase (beta-lactamase class C family)
MVTALEPFVREHRIAGAVAVVATKDQVLCLEPIGYADVDAQTPMRTDNMFWIASMTKPITTTAMMMLVDEGKLNIEDPAEKYLPEFKELRIADSVDNSSLRAPRHPVTVKELLTHTSGMTESKKNHNLSLQDDVATFVADPMENQPGTRYRYSNVGITVGGRIIEVLTGMSYGDFMQRRLFDKLGMTDTTFFPNEQQVERVARTFRAKADKTGIENLTFDVKFPTGNVPPKLLLHYGAPTVAQYKNHYAHPSGGLFSTAADLLKFCRMLLGGGVAGGKQYVSQAAIKQMTSIQTGDLTVNPQEGYGLGWLVQKKVDQGHPSIGSFGHRGARKTLMWIDPSRQIVMILLLQSYDMSNKDADALYTAFVNTAEAMASAP